MNVRLACFTFSFFGALLDEGVERKHAIELVADAAWGIYAVWSRLVSGVARLAAGNSALGFATKPKRGGRLSLRFPFNAPGYVIEAVTEMTNQKLVRTKTLVEGADRCDFRVLPAD